MKIKGIRKAKSEFLETDVLTEIELSPRELLEQLTHKEIGELLEFINLPKSTTPKLEEFRKKLADLSCDYVGVNTVMRIAQEVFGEEKFPKQFPISACCNASVELVSEASEEKERYQCQACGSECSLSEWNKENYPLEQPKKPRVNLFRPAYINTDVSFEIGTIKEKLNELIFALRSAGIVEEE